MKIDFLTKEEAAMMEKRAVQLNRLMEAIRRHMGDMVNREPPGNYDLELYRVYDEIKKEMDGGRKTNAKRK